MTESMGGKLDEDGLVDNEVVAAIRIWESTKKMPRKGQVVVDLGRSREVDEVDFAADGSVGDEVERRRRG